MPLLQDCDLLMGGMINDDVSQSLSVCDINSTSAEYLEGKLNAYLALLWRTDEIINVLPFA